MKDISYLTESIRNIMEQEYESRNVYNEAVIEARLREKVINEAVEFINEAYIGKTPTLQKIEDKIGELRGNLSRYGDFDRNKTTQEINRLFEEQFGMDVFALHMVNQNIMNAYTQVIALNFDVYKIKNFSDYLIADRKDGYRFRSGNNFCISANVYYGLLANPDLTDGEILAIILHEIGHNFADFIDGTVRLANQNMLDGFIYTNIMYIVINILSLNLPGVIQNIANLANAVFTMNNNRKNKTEKKDQNKRERKLSGLMGGIEGKWIDFVTLCSSILYKTNIISMGWAKLYDAIFVRPFQKGLKQSAKVSVDRRNEIIADKFAAVYGYGPELGTGLQKMGDYKYKDEEFIDKIPVFGKKINDFWDKLYLDINEFDCHPHDVQRINEAIKTLEDELKQSDMDPKLKSTIEKQIKEMKQNVENVKKMIDKDPKNMKVIYDAYVANKLPDATTQKIEDEINDEFNKALRKGTK